MTSHITSQKTVAFRQSKNLKVRQNNLLLNNDVVKNNTDVIILIRRLMLKFFWLKSRDVLYQVSSDLGEVVKNFYSSFSDVGQKTAWYRVNSRRKMESLCWTINSSKSDFNAQK